VLARLFVPGHELVGATESRATGVLARIRALPEDEVCSALRDVLARYTGRHRDLRSTLAAHYGAIAHRVPDGDALTEERRTLIGAWFTHEYSVEAAALFNPSIVPHPDQSGLLAGHRPAYRAARRDFAPLGNPGFGALREALLGVNHRPLKRLPLAALRRRDTHPSGRRRARGTRPHR
jgi:hypothetical protein